MLKSNLHLNIEFIKKDDDSRYANGNDIRLINLGPRALFSNFKLTTSSGKHLEDVSHPNITSSMYKLISSAQDSNDLSIGFDHSRNRRSGELTANKSVKGRYHLKNLLKGVFGFAECQKKLLMVLNMITRSKDDAITDKTGGIADARIRIDHIHWYVPHYTPSIQQQSIFSNQKFKKNHQNPDMFL